MRVWDNSRHFLLALEIILSPLIINYKTYVLKMINLLLKTFISFLLMNTVQGKVHHVNLQEPDPCFSNPCDIQAKCELNLDSMDYNCTCTEPYYGNGTYCSDPCNDDPCPYNEDCNGKYENGSVSYDCVCDDTEFYNDSNGNCVCTFNCPVRGELSDNPHDPQCQEQCTYATYECGDGYWLTRSDFCQEINECRPLNPCGVHGRCTLNPGNKFAYTCSCFAGHAFNGTTCVDVNECAATFWACKEGFKCVNTEGSFQCVCDETHSIAVLDHLDRLHCLDVNECASNNGGCAHNCENTLTGERCSCIDGFHLNTTDHKSCYLDQNNGSSLCNQSSKVGCGPGGVCIAQDDVELCQCFSAYSLNEATNSCISIGDCSVIKDNCYNGVKCHNSSLQPGYQCDCPNGFRKGPLGRCYEYNICMQIPGLCGIYGECVKTSGSYDCNCDAGYEMKPDEHGRPTCTAIDYCCHHGKNEYCEIQGKACRNILGSFECFCPIPYYPLGLQDDFACVPPDDDAYILSVKMSLLGFYNATISYSFQRNMEVKLKDQLFGTILPAVDIKNLQITSFEHAGTEVRVRVDVYFESDVPYLKELIHKSCGNYKYIKNLAGCALPLSLVINYATLSVTRYAMCGENDLWLCGPLATCVPGVNNYTCQCKTGYAVDGYKDMKKPYCVDVDECEMEPSYCGNSSKRCINTVGSYFCVCNDCYYSNTDETVCLHICEENPCKHDGQCFETRMAKNCGYSCRCATDYYGPNCDRFNDDVKAANVKTAITGGVLGGILFITFVIGGIFAYRSLKQSGYFVFPK